MKSLFIGLVVLILFIFSGIYLVNLNQSDSPATSTPTSTPPTQTEPGPEGNNEANEGASVPADFRSHAEPEQRYQIAIPYNVDVSNPQAGITRYRYVGPNNEPNSEITDGYTITIEARPRSTSSLEALATQKTEGDLAAVVTEPQPDTVAGHEALRYVTESALNNRPITHYVVLPGNEYEYEISSSVIPADNTAYEVTVDEIIDTLQFFDAEAAEALTARIVPIAMLDYTAAGSQYIRESSGIERGCDKVVVIEHVLDAPTTSPLTASLEQLFAYEQATVGGWQNFIADQTETLSFSRAEITNGTASVYLTGALGPLAGVCDNPRAAIQIEETALAHDDVSAVELYLNDQPTDLIPSGQGE